MLSFVFRILFFMSLMLAVSYLSMRQQIAAKTDGKGKTTEAGAKASPLSAVTSMIQPEKLLQSFLGKSGNNSNLLGMNTASLLNTIQGDSAKAETAEADSQSSPTTIDGSYTVMYFDDAQKKGTNDGFVVKELDPGARVIFVDGKPQFYYPSKKD